MKTQALFDSQKFVQAYAKKLNLENIKKTIFCFSSSTAKKISLQYKAKTYFCLGARFDIYKDFKTLIVSQFGYGPSAAILQLEYLSALGIKTFYSFGMTCSLSKDFKLGQILLIEKAYPSLHTFILKDFKKQTSVSYLKDHLLKTSYQEDIKNLAQNFKIPCVKSLSSFFPFEETQDNYKIYCSQNISVLEMEAYHLLSLAQKKDLKIFCFCCVSDFINTSSWETFFSDKSLQKKAYDFLSRLLVCDTKN